MDKIPALLAMPFPQRAAAEIEAFNLKPDWLIVFASVLTVFVTICIALRVYVRGFMIRAFGLDDWLLIGAYILFLADAGIYMAIAMLQKTEGLIQPLNRIVLLALASTITYLADQVFIKIALGYFFLRVVKEGWQKWTIKGAVFFYALYTIVFILVVTFACGLPTPVNLLSGKCIPWKTQLGPLNYVAAVLNAVVDWILVCVPIYVVFTVNMSRKEKMSVSILMLLGLVGSVVSVIRIPYVAGVAHTPDLSFFWKVIPISLCSIAENGIGIMAISLAALRPLYARIFETARTRFGSSANTSRGGNKVASGYILNSTVDRDRDFTNSYNRQSVAPVRTLDPTGKFSLQNYSRPSYKNNLPSHNYNPSRGYVDMEKGQDTDYNGQHGHPMVLILPDPQDSDRSSDEIRPGRHTPSVASTLFPIQKNG